MRGSHVKDNGEGLCEEDYSGYQHVQDGWCVMQCGKGKERHMGETLHTIPGQTSCDVVGLAIGLKSRIQLVQTESTFSNYINPVAH